VLTPAGALQLLVDLGASPWLVRHHELVSEAALELCDLVRRDLGVAFDRELVLVGAALHDAGKIVHPDEMREPGSRHEAAGQQLLLAHGVPASTARFCVTHASWTAPTLTIEDLLVALADKLWKGKRIDDLEQRVADLITHTTGRERWSVFAGLDSICDSIAAAGPARLARSAV
jgi:putative nucleotidyltransferase with HDIG domain